MGRNWQLLTNRRLIYHEFCSEATSKLEEDGKVAEMAERSLCMREVRGSVPRISKTYLRLRQFYVVFADNGKELTSRYKSKADIHGFCSEDSSKLEGYGDVAQMVERLLSMREVRGSMPRISKTFWGFDNSICCLLITGRNWQLLTNRKLIYHGFCSETSSKLEGYGDVAQTVERLLRMREVRGSIPRISKHFWGFDNSISFWLTKGKNWQLVTNRKLIYHEFCSQATSKLKGYRDVAQMVERSLCMREVRGSVPRISKTYWGFDNSMWCLLIMGRNWQVVTNRKLIYMDFVQKIAQSLKGTVM